MSLPHIILGLLHQQERTGYDLKTECFDDCINHLWQADQAQIYRTLDKLEAQGWVRCTIEIQHDRPNRKIYCLTETGKAELTRWLQTHQSPPVLREPLLAQLYFSDPLPGEAVVHLLQRELEARRKKLENCQRLQNTLSPKGNQAPLSNDPALRHQTMHHLILELQLRREQTYLDWLKDAIKLIESEPVLTEI